MGAAEGHLCTAQEVERLGVPVHAEVVEPFLLLRDAGVHVGFDLAILSGYRSFERQLSIWNRKARGELAVLDSGAVPLDVGRLTETELVFAILRWSALPGGSRHHWGTDLDVFDASSTPAGYEIQLVPEEVDSGGMFGPLHDWLDERMEASDAYGFFRPYDRDRGGVSPERWHLSHGPTAAAFEEAMTVDILERTIRSAEIELKGAILACFDEIYERFVINIGRPPS
jgi:LAS superfamily LD-carboxypeptidase LdcB